MWNYDFFILFTLVPAGGCNFELQQQCSLKVLTIENSSGDNRLCVCVQNLIEAAGKAIAAGITKQIKTTAR